jgi:hypothetical protein
MDTSAFDFPAILLGVATAAVITAATSYAAGGGDATGNSGGRWRRLIIVGGALTLVLGTLAFMDLLREQPRETHVATVIVGVLLPNLGAVGMQQAARRVRPWIRWTLVFVTVFVLLFAGLLIGAAFVPRFL